MRFHRRVQSVSMTLALCATVAPAVADATDPAAAVRGEKALLGTGYVRPGWKDDTYRRVGKLWGPGAPDPSKDPAGYAAAFRQRYGLHPAPYPNPGAFPDENLPMGLRRGVTRDGRTTGLTFDCMVCHGGSIGGQSYVGLGNTQLDMKRLIDDMAAAEGRVKPVTTFVVNTVRGTVNAGMMGIVLLSLRNTDLSFRMFPLPLGASVPEEDVPAWWILAKKETKYHDGRTPASSVRANMQFLLAEKTLGEFRSLEPTFRDIQEYLKSLKPPKYPFPVETVRAERGGAVFAANCAKCHGTYGPEATYPNRVVELKIIGTDPARALGISKKSVEHYNATWFGENDPADPEMVGYQAPPLDGVWATAPYLHNGSVPTLHSLLKSSTRPARYKRPPSTDFDYYDREHVGWKFEALESGRRLTPDERPFDYDTTRIGLGNGGHTFGDKLSEADRMDLIEYLKTL